VPHDSRRATGFSGLRQSSLTRRRLGFGNGDAVRGLGGPDALVDAIKPNDAAVQRVGRNETWTLRQNWGKTLRGFKFTGLPSPATDNLRSRPLKHNDLIDSERMSSSAWHCTNVLISWPAKRLDTSISPDFHKISTGLR
jgi:hypothetical protein